MEITARNANDLFSAMLWRFKTEGVLADSRNGPVIMIDEPVLTKVYRPQERVLFFDDRDANPIFHLLESIWILAGRRDVEFVKMFNSRIGAYSDDGEHFNAAYGHRMRHHFNIDQLIEAVLLLKREPQTRRCVIQLHDARDLVNQGSKDHACNTQLVFMIRDGRLEMTTYSRSNDGWYGYAGANIVHMTIIQEFVASALGIPMGRYFTVSNNLHLYTQLYDATKFLNVPPDASDYDVYAHGIEPSPIFTHGESWLAFLNDCENFCDDPFQSPSRYVHDFFRNVAFPMAMVSRVRKDKTANGHYWANQITALDWRIATQDWITRREKVLSLTSGARHD